MSLEGQLLDGDGAIISIAAVDETFWANYGGSATTYANQRGIGVFVATYPPDAGTAERNVAQWGDFTQWVASTSVGLRAPPSTTSTSTFLVVGVALAAAAALVSMVLASRPRARR